MRTVIEPQISQAGASSWKCSNWALNCCITAASDFVPSGSCGRAGSNKLPLSRPTCWRDFGRYLDNARGLHCFLAVIFVILIGFGFGFFDLGFDLGDLLGKVTGLFHDLPGGSNILIFAACCRGAVRGIMFRVAGDELAAHPAEDIIDYALGERDISVRGHSRRLETSVPEFIHQRNQWHTILQRHRRACPNDIHQGRRRCCLLWP